jgi:hypothetical protein
MQASAQGAQLWHPLLPVTRLAVRLPRIVERPGRHRCHNGGRHETVGWKVLR